jgi:apolipoprotein N-acyltransferase
MPVLLAALCGALFSAALPPTNLWAFVLAMVPLMVFLARSERLSEAFMLGFAFALPFFGLHLLWLPLSFTELFGQVAWIIFPPLVVILAAMWGLVTLASRLLGGYGRGTLWLLPALWVLAEWLRSQGSLAFPWGFVGYAWVGTPLAQVADLAGVYGLSLLTLVVLALLASLWAPPSPSRYALAAWRPSLAPVVVALSLLVIALAYSGTRLSATLPPPTEQALLVQGNTNPLERVNGLDEDLMRHARLTASALAELEEGFLLPDLVIWPEGAVLWPDLSDEDAPESAEARTLVQESALGLPVITGGGARDQRGDYNSVFSLVGERVVDRYDKVYLVPFGESFPLQDAMRSAYSTVFTMFGLPFLASRAAGEEIRPLSSLHLLVGVYICYESVFPQVPRTMARKGAQVLSNISNDAWYGRGPGAEQHFLMGSMRAIETRRYILRAGNDGITAVIDPMGRMLQDLPRGIEGTLVVGYGLRDGLTPYVRFGDWLMAALLLYVPGYLGFRRWFG